MVINQLTISAKRFIVILTVIVPLAVFMWMNDQVPGDIRFELDKEFRLYTGQIGDLAGGDLSIQLIYPASDWPANCADCGTAARFEIISGGEKADLVFRFGGLTGETNRRLGALGYVFEYRDSGRDWNSLSVSRVSSTRFFLGRRCISWKVKLQNRSISKSKLKWLSSR